MTHPIDTTPEAIAALLDGVTPGPWVEFISDDGGKWTGWPVSIECTSIVDKTIIRPGGHWPYEWDAKTSCDEACANARFIAAARELVPALAAEIARLTAERDEARAQVAMAFEVAAHWIESVPQSLPNRQEYARHIRALPPAEATTALAARDAAMRNEGRKSVKVKPLVWERLQSWRARWRSDWGDTIETNSLNHFVIGDNVFDRRPDAIDWAQGRHEARILAALEPEGGE